MWILKNSKDLLDYIQSRPLSSCNNIKTFDFSTLYTAIPHSKLKERLRELIQLCFIKRNGQCRYKYLVLVRDKSYFVKKKKTLWFYQKVLWDWYHQHTWVFDLQHICYVWWTSFSTDKWHTIQTAPFLADFFLYSSEADFIYLVIKKNKTKLARSFNWFHQIFSKWQVVGLSHFVRPPDIDTWFVRLSLPTVLELQL
jgi:hypothetical protein